MIRKRTFLKIHNRFICMPNWMFILSMVISKYIIILVFAPLLFLIQTYTGDLGGPSFVTEESSPSVIIYGVIIYGVIIGPIIETLIFQRGIINLTRKIKVIKNRVWLQIGISAIIFGICHTYSLAYSFVGFLLGLVLAYSYKVFEYKKSNAFWNVAIIHGLGNLLSLLLKFIENGSV